MARQRPLFTLLAAAALGCGAATERVVEIAEVPPSGESAATTATPTIWIQGTLVTILCATPGAHVYYTLDGTAPSNQSTIYAGPFSVTIDPATLVIKAIATAPGMGDSEVATEAILNVATLYEEDFSTNPAWHVTNAGTGNVWQWSAGAYRIRYSTSTREEDSRLVSPSLFLPGRTRAFLLIFDETWRGGYESFWSDGEVQISTDGGASWERLALVHHEEPADPDHEVTQQLALDLSPWAGRTIRIAFRYHGLYDWFWYIDRVVVAGS